MTRARSPSLSLLPFFPPPPSPQKKRGKRKKREEHGLGSPLWTARAAGENQNAFTDASPVINKKMYPHIETGVKKTKQTNTERTRYLCFEPNGPLRRIRRFQTGTTITIELKEKERKKVRTYKTVRRNNGEPRGVTSLKLRQPVTLRKRNTHSRYRDRRHELETQEQLKRKTSKQSKKGRETWRQVLYGKAKQNKEEPLKSVRGDGKKGNAVGRNKKKGIE